MNNNINSNNVDPNKIKPCPCEDKYGPKPFDVKVNTASNKSK